MKSRIVLDTSTLIGAAIRADSTPRRALRLALGSYELCISESIVAELEMVMERPRLLKYASEDIYRAFVELLRAEARIYSLSLRQIDGVVPSCRDAKDNHILALAQTAAVNCMISSDKDLLVLNPWNGIPILSPAVFLSVFGDASRL